MCSSDLVDVSGDYALRIQRGPEADDDQVTVLSRDASVWLSLGSEIRIGALDTTLALVINEDETFVIQAAGLPDIHLGIGFDASVSATAVGFSYNNTGRDWDQTVSVNVGDVDVSVAVQVRDDVATAIVTDLEARVADYVSLAGTFAFEKQPASAESTASFLVVAQDASAFLDIGTAVHVGVSDVELAMVLLEDGRLALQTSGAAELSFGAGFASASAERIDFAYNNTGQDRAGDITLKVSDVSVSAPLNVADGQTIINVTGLQAQIGDILSISGDFGLRKTTDATPGQDELQITSQNAAVSLTAGDVVTAAVRNVVMDMCLRGDDDLTLDLSGSGWLKVGQGTVVADAARQDIGHVVGDALVHHS